MIDHPQAAEIVTRWVDRASQLAPRDARSVPRPQVRQAARSFRYARNLLAAEELDAWLVACDVSTEGWQDVLCRQLLAEPDVPEGTDEPDPELLWSVGVCEGYLAEALDVVSVAAAVASTVDQPWSEDATEAIAAFRAEAASDEMIAREVEMNPADWMAVTASWLTLRHEGAGREARLCLTNDLRSPDDVASLAQTHVQRGSWYLRDAPPGLHELCLSTPSGGVAGPRQVEDGHVVLVVDHRRPADPADPNLRREVATVLADRATRRLVEDRTRRLLPL